MFTIILIFAFSQSYSIIFYVNSLIYTCVISLQYFLFSSPVYMLSILTSNLPTISLANILRQPKCFNEILLRLHYGV